MIDIERLKSRLEALNLSANAASLKAGLGRDYVRDVLRGRIKDPSAYKLSNLSEALECSPNYLLGLDESPDYEWLIADRKVDDRGEENIERFLKSHQKSSNSQIMFLVTTIDTLENNQFLLAAGAWMDVVLHHLLTTKTEVKITSEDLYMLVGDVKPYEYAQAIRRLALARLTNIISEDTYRKARVLAELRDLASRKVADDVLSTSQGKELKRNFLETDPKKAEPTDEMIRLGIVALLLEHPQAFGYDLVHENPA